MFYDNLKNACEDKGLKVTPYAQSLGLTSGIVGNWKKGGIPRQEILVQMASDLDVSIDFLLTGKNHKEKTRTVLTDDARQKWIEEMLPMVEKLSLEKLELLKQFSETMLEQEKEK